MLFYLKYLEENMELLWQNDLSKALWLQIKWLEIHERWTNSK